MLSSMEGHDRWLEAPYQRMVEQGEAEMLAREQAADSDNRRDELGDWQHQDLIDHVIELERELRRRDEAEIERRL